MCDCGTPWTFFLPFSFMHFLMPVNSHVTSAYFLDMTRTAQICDLHAYKVDDQNVNEFSRSYVEKEVYWLLSAI